jgi:hypothetical protein
MGNDPSAPGYHRPGSGGVCRFMARIAAWISDPRRKGMRRERIPLDRQLPPPARVPAPAAGAEAAAV